MKALLRLRLLGLSSVLSLVFLIGLGWTATLQAQSDGSGQDENGDSSLPIIELIEEGERPLSSESSSGGDRAPEHRGPAPIEEHPAVEESPWASVSELELPSFLQITKRPRQDDRPPPSPEMVEALRLLEHEVNNYERAGASYRDLVTSILKRDYLRQRRTRSLYYGKRIDAESERLAEARESAIREFERFIKRYPDSDEYTADAMFRLGELYFERAKYNAQKRVDEIQEALDRGEDPGDQSDADPDLMPVVELYQRLLRQYPDYERVDGVYYLIGYCLNEMARMREALEAWLALVCANEFKYPNPPPEPLPGEERPYVPRHPALHLNETMPRMGRELIDRYKGCEPVREDARFVTETWFRIGEYHFDDYIDLNSLSFAYSAYQQILRWPDDQNYNLALYKIAWTFYRGGQYEKSIEYFAKLIDWSDERQRLTGREGSMLRPEAMEYIGLSFAYDDWNENQIPDEREGLPSGLQRIQDPRLLPQDRPWTPEAYFRLGDVYFNDALFLRAVDVWRVALRKWPNHLQVPHYLDRIAEAYREEHEFEEEMKVLAELSSYVQGSDWWNANLEHPKELREAEQLAENALIRTAVHQHIQAQRLRGECIEFEDIAKCLDAKAYYERAADGYRAYLIRYPNHLEAYELHLNLADALFWSERYEEAAAEYAAVRDSNLDDRYLSEAARMVVESLKRLLERAEEEGRVIRRDEPPPPEGSPPRVSPVDMPLLVQRLAQAHEMYLARVEPSQDTEQLRGVYDYNNAILLYLYGYWDHSRARLLRIFNERCEGPQADDTGRVAWESLTHMAIQLGDNDQLEELASALEKRQCSFGASPDAPIDCSRPEFAEQPLCRASGIRTAIEYRRAIELYEQAELLPPGDERTRLYERSATLLVAAVNRTPDNPQAPIALEFAASALVKTQRFESASRLYQRIIDEVAPRRSDDPDEQRTLDNIVSNAYFQLAVSANRFFDFDRAITNYGILADSPRFANSTDPRIITRRADALVNTAIILEQLGRNREARTYYQRVHREVTDPETRRLALYRIAEITYEESSGGTAGIRAMRDFINEYRNDPSAAELVIRANFRIAEAYAAMRASATQRRDYEAALRATVSAFNESRLPPGSVAAEYAAEAHFRLVDDIEAFEATKITMSTPRTLEDYVRELLAQIEQAAMRATALRDEYEPVLRYNRPAWIIAAYVRQGRVYEALVRMVLELPFVTPQDLQAEMRRLPPEDREEIRFMIEDRIRQVLDAQVRPFECLAVVRYALASRVARATSFDNEITRLAIDRLQAYGDERIASCIEDHQQVDPTFESYRDGEFTRAPRGQLLELPDDAKSAPLEEVK